MCFLEGRRHAQMLGQGKALFCQLARSVQSGLREIKPPQPCEYRETLRDVPELLGKLISPDCRRVPLQGPYAL